MVVKKYYDAVIIGGNGQDGFLMSRYILKKKKRVLVLLRRENKFIRNLKKKYINYLSVIVSKNFTKENYVNFLSKFKFKKVYFLAGYSKIPSNKFEKQKCLTGNFTIFKNMLYACLQLKIKPKILYLSSGEIFGSNQLSKKNEGSRYKNDNFYSECKIKSCELIKFFRYKYDFFIVNIIAYNHESVFTPQNHLLRKMIDLFENKKKNKLVIYNPGDYRNISHTYDLLPLIYKSLDIKKCDDFVFANDENISLKRVISIINRFYGKSVKFKYDKHKILSRMADNTKIKKIFNYSPNFSAEKIILRMISYHRKNYFIK